MPTRPRRLYIASAFLPTGRPSPPRSFLGPLPLVPWATRFSHFFSASLSPSFRLSIIINNCLEEGDPEGDRCLESLRSNLAERRFDFFSSSPSDFRAWFLANIRFSISWYIIIIKGLITERVLWIIRLSFKLMITSREFDCGRLRLYVRSRFAYKFDKSERFLYYVICMLTQIFIESFFLQHCFLGDWIDWSSVRFLWCTLSVIFFFSFKFWDRDLSWFLCFSCW